MVSWRFLGLIAIVAVSGTTGWALSEQWHAMGESALPPGVESNARSSTAPSATLSSGQAQAQRPVTLYGDGTVTINVQDRPLQWLLEEIARQGGGEVAAPASVQNAAAQPVAAATETGACNEGPCPETNAQEQAEALQAIHEGNEQARYEALLTASSLGLSLPQETLKTLSERDTSERVRSLAFEQYLNAVQESLNAVQETSVEDTRATLQAALYSPSAAIQTQATMMLDQLMESERVDEASPQAGEQ